MKLLHKYHKQDFDKKSLALYENINKTYQLKYPTNLKYTLKLSMIKHSILQKKVFEETFERFRNNHLDMWDNLNFTERNRLFQMDFLDQRSKLKNFVHDNETIYIPIFNVLFNNLYDRETAILDLPQYYKLSKEFKEDMVDPEVYGLLPYQAGISDFPCIAYRDDSVILFNQSLNTFYRLNDQAVAYPLYKNSDIDSESLTQLGQALVEFNDAEFLNIALEKGYLHPRLIKKLEKKR